MRTTLLQSLPAHLIMCTARRKTPKEPTIRICMAPPQSPEQLVYRQSLSHRPAHVITSAPPRERMQLIQLVRLGPHSFRKAAFPLASVWCSGARSGGDTESHESHEETQAGAAIFEGPWRAVRAKRPALCEYY